MAAKRSTSAWQRYLVVAALFLLSLITYIDRAAISTAKRPMAEDLSLSDAQMGAVFSAFALGYAAAQMPSGWFADRIGPRRALAIVVVLWSLLTSLTGMMTQFGPLLAVRLLFGVAEAGAYPGSARVFYNWLPAGERGIANGILFSGGLLGAAFAFPIFAWLVEQYDWRGAFYLLGAPGLIWAVCWLIWFRDFPRERIVHDDPVGGPDQRIWPLLRSRGMLLAMFQYFAGNFTFYICISWMHPYLLERYAMSQGEAARYCDDPSALRRRGELGRRRRRRRALQVAVPRVVAAHSGDGRLHARCRRGCLGIHRRQRRERHLRVRRRDVRRRDDDQPQLELLPGRGRKEFRGDIGCHEHGGESGRRRQHECLSTPARLDGELRDILLRGRDPQCRRRPVLAADAGGWRSRRPHHAARASHSSGALLT